MRGTYTKNSKVAWVQLQTEHFKKVSKVVVGRLLQDDVSLVELTPEQARKFVKGPVAKRNACEQGVGGKGGEVEQQKKKEAKKAAALARLDG